MDYYTLHPVTIIDFTPILDPTIDQNQCVILSCRKFWWDFVENPVISCQANTSQNAIYNAYENFHLLKAISPLKWKINNTRHSKEAMNINLTPFRYLFKYATGKWTVHQQMVWGFLLARTHWTFGQVDVDSPVR